MGKDFHGIDRPWAGLGGLHPLMNLGQPVVMTLSPHDNGLELKGAKRIQFRMINDMVHPDVRNPQGGRLPGKRKSVPEFHLDNNVEVPGGF